MGCEGYAAERMEVSQDDHPVGCRFRGRGFDVYKHQRRSSMSKLRVHNFAISLDGYGAGPDQSLENPLGVDGLRLHEWVFATRYWSDTRGGAAGKAGIDDEFVARGDLNIGATIMGRNMFGPIRG